MYNNNNAKRPKIKTLKLDRISELHDSIIVHILSFLLTTEEAIRTGILSKRWRYVWTSIPTLDFSNEERPFPDFALFIDQTLNQCHHSKLKKFRVFCFDEFGPQMYRWIRYAVDCNVEELHFLIDPDSLFELPVYLFRNNYLTSLEIRGCACVPNGQVSWKLLKKLSIRCTELSGDLIQNMICGSPVLEILVLLNCYGFNRLDITSTSVKKLVLDGYFDLYNYEDDAVLEIFAPDILSLDIIGDIRLRKLLLVNVSSLVEASLDFERNTCDFEPDVVDPNGDESMVKDLLQSLQHVNELTIGGWFMQEITFLQLRGWHSPLSRLKSLKIGRFLERSAFPGLSNLLQCSPALEILRINVDDAPYLIKRPWGYRTRVNYLTCKERSYQCLQQHLKTVEVAYSMEWDCGTELVQFLLENACVLEKIVIYSGSEDVNESSLMSRALGLLQLTTDLLSFPRASKNATVLFQVSQPQS